MYTTTRRPRRAAPLAATILGLVALALLAPPAHAGFGDLVRKAKEKATQTVAPKAAKSEEPDEGEKVVYDDKTLELTNARVEHILASFQVAIDLSAPRPGMVEKLNKIMSDRDDIWEKQGQAIRDLRNKRDEKERCYHDGYRDAADKKAQEYSQRAITGDPALIQKFSRAAQQHNTAAARGDSAAQSALNATMMSEILPSKEDSAKVRLSCGPLPPKSAAEERFEKLDQQANEAQDQIRKLDEKIAAARSKAGGLEEDQWSIALERMRNYMSWRNSHPPPAGGSGSSSSGASAKLLRAFSAAEIDAMEKHLAKLKVVLYE